MLLKHTNCYYYSNNGAIDLAYKDCNGGRFSSSSAIIFNISSVAWLSILSTSDKGRRQTISYVCSQTYSDVVVIELELLNSPTHCAASVMLVLKHST